MTYSTGTQGAQTNCSKVFMESVLDPALVAAGYVFVEQVVNGSVTVRVYRSPGGSNFFGQDWYLIVKRTTDAATTVGFGVTEQYNSSTHLCFNYGPSASAGLVPTAQFAVNDPSGKAPDNSAIGVVTVAVTTTGFSWFFSLTPDRAVVSTRTSDNYMVYAGLYDDFQAPAVSPFPLISNWPLSGGASPTGLATREPGVTVANSNNFHIFSSADPWTRLPGNNTLEVISGEYWLARPVVPGRVSTLTTMRGLYRNLWMCNVVGTNGDTVSATISGASRTLVQTNNSTSVPALFVDTAV